MTMTDMVIEEMEELSSKIKIDIICVKEARVGVEAEAETVVGSS